MKNWPRQIVLNFVCRASMRDVFSKWIEQHEQEENTHQSWRRTWLKWNSHEWDRLESRPSVLAHQVGRDQYEI